MHAARLILVVALLALVAFLGGGPARGPLASAQAAAPACSDGVDNDGDGLIDYPADPGCSSAADTDESNPPLPECRDHKDNDGDGVVDYPADPSCADANDPTERHWDGECTSNCICAADQDGDGSADQPNEQAACDTLSGHAMCQLDRVACQARTISVWDQATGSTHTETQQVCPSDPNAPCLKNGSVYQCSKDPCFDSTKVVPIQTQDPSTDPPNNDGARDASGNCLGLIRIFPGNAARCHKAGTQTDFQNCCKNKLGKMDDTMGAPGEQNQRDYKKQASAVQFWSNQCDPKDQSTAKLADSGYCIDLGTYCAEKWPLVGCVQKNHGYCCFNSQLARIIQEQGRPQLRSFGANSFGDPDHPQCRGFSPDEFQALDFSKIDLSSYYASIRTQAQGQMQSTTQQRLQNEIQSGGP